MYLGIDDNRGKVSILGEVSRALIEAMRPREGAIPCYAQ
jgi:hypothetical protein